jgi:hypothetical protein
MNEIECCVRILQVVGKLHEKGYQRIRISPGMAANGLRWRCSITTKDNILRRNGALIKANSRSTVNYGSNSDGVYWGKDLSMSLDDLADEFLNLFPEIAKNGMGKDREYVLWYRDMLEKAREGELPVAFGDWYDEPEPGFLPTTKNFRSDLKNPPPGEAE